MPPDNEAQDDRPRDRRRPPELPYRETVDKRGHLRFFGKTGERISKAEADRRFHIHERAQKREARVDKWTQAAMKFDPRDERGRQLSEKQVRARVREVFRHSGWSGEHRKRLEREGKLRTPPEVGTAPTKLNLFEQWWRHFFPQGPSAKDAEKELDTP